MGLPAPCVPGAAAPHFGMTFRKATASLLCAAAALLSQSCVEYVPVASYPPPPQPPPYPAQYAAEPPSQPPPPESAPTAPPAPPGPDDSLVAPIALYPDPLIALILPASTFPGDVSSAASYLVQYGDMTRIDSQPWDPSVRGLAHYPTVVTWMAQNMPWTQALGAAFIASPGGVMDAVQRMRARAMAEGTLTSTPQQQVYSDDGMIDIYPAQADTLYVPVYDDTVVYSEGPYSGYAGPFESFGDPYPAGDWLSFSFDWSSHRVWSGGRSAWHEHGGWQPPHGGGDRSPPGAHAWRPPSGRPAGPQSAPSASSAPHPRPMPGAPRPAPSQNGRSPALPGQAPGSPMPRTSAPPPASRPQPENAAPAPGTYNRPAQNTLAPPPPRQYSAQPSRGGSEAPAPRAAPAREAAPARGSAPAPSQDNGKQEPPK